MEYTVCAHGVRVDDPAGCAGCTADLAEENAAREVRIAAIIAAAEPESLHWDMVMHRPTDADIPGNDIPDNDVILANPPRWCALCGAKARAFEWSPIGWVCVGTLDDVLEEQRAFYPF